MLNNLYANIKQNKPNSIHMLINNFVSIHIVKCFIDISICKLFEAVLTCMPASWCFYSHRGKQAQSQPDTLAVFALVLVT